MHEYSDSARALQPLDTFARRHIGPRDDDIAAMLRAIGLESLEALVDATVPKNIRLERPLRLPEPLGEQAALDELRKIAARNTVRRNFIGMGYYDCVTPPVILRNILENPGWYTQYTPYQAEIAQGRLEALLNFQTMVADLTGLPLANASLLDEATAAAEAMTMCRRISKVKGGAFFVADDCHPQTIAVIQTRAKPLGIELRIGDPATFDLERGGAFGVLLQYPTTDGRICDYSQVIEQAHAAGALAVMATDLLALTLIKPPGEWGADIAVGSAQRFGVPLGGGGPHAAFMATHQKHARQMPGRIVGVSKDASGKPAYRLAVQTREQHIRRDRATSNICTAQVLLAIMASMYAVYHGPDGLREIAERVHLLTCLLADKLREIGHEVGDEPFFDTLKVRLRSGGGAGVLDEALKRSLFNFRDYGNDTLGVSLDETTDIEALSQILLMFNDSGGKSSRIDVKQVESPIPDSLVRKSDYLRHSVFNDYHSEHEMLRYITRLQSRDLSLTTSMIPLGSCTMKLNAVAEMLPITWPEFANIHPYAPADQTAGYAELYEQLERWLAEMTGFAAVSLQPNSGAQGEYAGLLAIRAFHESRGQAERDVCLIPTSAHGTNPASAVLAGCRVVVVKCDKHGNVDVDDMREKAEQHRENLAALMITYPSTPGVFEPSVRE
ncbi:MAG: aminomethyl-transferring glycine dehydrogenase, partial [Planctomycetes bacterium]|nr:aminomethyl-transferring glycine dehydrogenase [Planctomycetota bacterium]